MTELLEAMQAKEAEAFRAGWDACAMRHSGLFLTHGISDLRPGFMEAWSKYIDRDLGLPETGASSGSSQASSFGEFGAPK
jgi:hypothetical protein